MEGLLINEQLRELAPLLPAARLAWRFPDDRTAVLPLAGERSLWIVSRPPQPSIALLPGAPELASPNSPFQQQLLARASGRLASATQPQLDRVLRLCFAPSDDFAPVPAVELIVELTGRNANLVLVDDDGVIIGVERQVLQERNRYRELRVGVPYLPPPPYRKLNPLTASAAELRSAIAGRPVSEIRRVVDGIGPLLAAALKAELASRSEDNSTALELSLGGEELDRAISAVQRLASEPSRFLAEVLPERDVTADHDEDQRQRQLRVVTNALRGELELARRRKGDAERALWALKGLDTLRGEADLLLAYAHEVPAGEKLVVLPAFEGGEQTVELDPKLSVAANAAARYDQARRREVRADRARRQLPELEAKIAQVEADLESLATLSPDELRTRAAQLTPTRPAKSRSAAAGPGIRFAGPHGFEVVVGRNARDNDRVTFDLGRSRDIWLHAQGYRGSHVLIRSGGAEVPFETVLFAARLAAGYSEARRSDNVAVDYTARKNVWKVRRGPPGAVHFTQQRTVYVTPARDDRAASGEGEAAADRGGSNARAAGQETGDA